MPQSRRIALQVTLHVPYKRHAAVLAGTQKYAAEQGWTSIVDEIVDDKLEHLGNRRCDYDGIIARATPKLVKYAGRLGVPVVNVWYSSPMQTRLPGVFGDFQAVGRLRAEHLLSRGLRHFAVVSCHDDLGNARELEGFNDTLAEEGFEPILAQVPLSWYMGSWKQIHENERVIRKWMDQWILPIGVFVYSEALGRQVTQMCMERGWHVPGDVAIIAGHNQETICELPRPSLTSVEIGYDRIGYEAARLLDQLMDDAEAAKKKKKKTPQRQSTSQSQQPASPAHLLIPPVGLVIRESTDFYAVDDPLIAEALSYIAKSCHRNIGVGDVARAVITEPKTLQRRFGKVLGSSIAQEIRRVRIERAKRELAQGDRSLKEIARQCGFGPRMRMYEVFRRELNLCPSEYRKQVLGKRKTEM